MPNNAHQSILLHNHCSPGDVLMLTAAIRDLHRAHGSQYRIGVDTLCPDLFLHNPYVRTIDPMDPAVVKVECGHPPLLDCCNGQPRHYIEAIHNLLARRLGKAVPLTRFAPDIHLSDEERREPPHDLHAPYWIVMAGGKRDLTVKWWPSSYCQAVVDHFKGKLRFVQTGCKDDHHPRLHGAVDLIGRTSLRDLVRLVFHADGVICPITFAMHCAAAFDKPCVVVAGGREPPHWEMYPAHQFLHTVGQLSCCARGGCWKARVAPLDDGDSDRDNNLCVQVETVGNETAPACMKLIEPGDVIAAVERYIRIMHFEASSLSEANAAAQFDRVMSSVPRPSGVLEGRGIVIPAGGPKYFACAYANIRMLRHVGCQLPVELWHLGPREVDDAMRRLVEPWEVTCVDTFEVRKQYPCRILNGWELKPYSIFHSRFAEVIMLDADNVPIVDPTFLFNTAPYAEHGAIFWPDYGRLTQKRTIWSLTGIPFRDEPEFETGQIVIDKHRCWKQLSLTMWMNEHSDFWYRHIHGDKETFHMAWRKSGRDYAMPTRGIESLDGIMCQHDFDGRRIFQHRNSHKFRLDTPNPRISGFMFEKECLGFLGELDRLWVSRPNRRFNFGEAEEHARALAGALCNGRWIYHRVGHDRRKMSFALDGTVKEGSAACEQTWQLFHRGETWNLVVSGQDGVTFKMCPGPNGGWCGEWVIHEHMPVELLPE